jgi:hypothetical protein
MSRRSILTIVVGLLVFAVTLLVSNWVTISRREALPSSGLDLQTRVEEMQLTDTIQTSFIFIEVVELMLTGLLAFLWRGSKSPGVDGPGEGRQGTSSTLVWFSMFPGILAFIANYISSLLDVFVFDVYGGIGLGGLRCTGVPAVFFGILGGLAWYGLRRKHGFARYDIVPLIVIGILAGLIPGACVKLLPQ